MNYHASNTCNCNLMYLNMSCECQIERQTCFVNHESKWLFFFSAISRDEFLTQVLENEQPKHE